MAIGIEEFMKTASAEQKSLLFKLSDLAEKESELCKKIDRIYPSASKRPRIYSDSVGITLCEDADDANVISLGSKLELKEVRDEIATLLKKAVNELGMEDVGIIQRQYKNYINDDRNG